MTKKKLLFVGGGYADIPLIAAARKLGYYVISSGNRPDEMGHSYSDEYQFADFSDKDCVLDVAAKNKVDAICSCCNDFSALSVAYAAEKLGLPGHDGYETAKIVHHKDSYREFALKNSIPAPRAKGFKDVDNALAGLEEFNFPVMVKPVDLTGGKGISRMDSFEQAHSVVENAFAVSKSKRIVIEEYVSGTRHGFSAMLHDRKVKFFFIDNEYYYKNPYLVAAASCPSLASAEVEKKLVYYCEKIASALALKDGILHVQFILSRGEPVIIEICRRAPGDLYVQLVKHATGIDYPAWIVKAETGADISGLRQAPPNGIYSRHCLMTDKNGVIKDIVFDKSLKDNIIDKLMWWKPGDLVSDFMTRKFGILFLKYGSLEEMNAKSEAIHELIKVELI